MTCSFCGSYRHERRVCPSTWAGQAALAALRCTYCGSVNHNRDACPLTWPGPDPIVRGRP